MSLLQLSGVTKVFSSGTQALNGFNLSVAAGEVVTLIGPSGCGKSTVLRLIAGLEEPTEGQVRWSGGRPRLGYVFQDPTLMPWASASDNVWLPLRIGGISRREAAPRIQEALELVGLEEFAGAKPQELSGGMRMRVSIARALATEPKLLLLDEPFAALDEITRFRLNDELLGLRERLRLTIVFVTHSVFEAVFLSTRIVVMTPRPGRVAAVVGNEEPFPRSDAFRTSVRYAERAAEVSAALRAACRLDHP